MSVGSWGGIEEDGASEEFWIRVGNEQSLICILNGISSVSSSEVGSSMKFGSKISSSGSGGNAGDGDNEEDSDKWDEDGDRNMRKRIRRE